MNMSSWTSTQEHGAAAQSVMGEKQAQVNGDVESREEGRAEPAQPEPPDSFKPDGTGSGSAGEL